MKTKRYYNKGLSELKKAIKLLESAETEFACASYSLDDFPTARHEIMDISKKIERLKIPLERLRSFAYDTRIK